MGNGVTENTEMLDLLPGCQQDNLFIFNVDNTITTDEGATKCDPGDPQSRNAGRWMLLSGNMLFMENPTNTLLTARNGKILQLDNSTMNLQYASVINGLLATVTTTYIHVP
jgi:hypothetical protein